MSFIELKPGLKVRMCAIESIELTEEGGSRVMMESGTEYTTDFRYEQLVQFIKQEESKEEQGKTRVSPQFFAG